MSLRLIPRVRVNYGYTDLISAIFATERKHAARKECERLLSSYFNDEYVCLEPSARDAIYELLIRLPQKKVVIPAYTCMAVVEAVLLAGKEIVYSKNSDNTYNSVYLDDISPNSIVLATHQYGLPCNIEEVAHKCKEVGAILIEDCATSMGTMVNGKKTGTFGDYAVVSFNSSKLLNVPPFGGVLISKDKQMIEDIKSGAVWKKPNLKFKIKGLIRGMAFVLTKNVYFYRLFHYLTIASKGKLQKTEHEKPSDKKTDLYTYQFSEWQAVILLRQLKQLDKILAKRRELYEFYDKRIANPLVKKPLVNNDAVCCRYAIQVSNRSVFYRECIKQGVDMDFSHCSLGCPDSFKEEHEIAGRILNLPYYYHLSEKEKNKVVRIVNIIKMENKPFEGKHILVLEGYTKQSLPFIRGFKKLGCEVSVLCGTKWDCAYSSRYPDHKILGTCDLHEPVESEKYIVELVKTRKFDMVFAPFEFSARILSHNKEELSKYAIIYAMDKEVFDRVNNKEEVMRVCMENGIPCPQTFFGIESIDDIDGRIQFPVIIKPHSMYGARGFHLFNTPKEMREYVKEKQIDLKGYVVQEYIPEGSRLMGGNVMIDRKGVIKSSYLYICEHIYPEIGGTSTLNGILVRSDISANCDKLVKLMGLQGEMGVDLMLDVRDNIGKVIEINPRPVHGIALGFYAGVNHAQQILEDAFGMEVTPMEVTKPKTASRIGQTDMLWFLKSKDRFRRMSWRLGYKPVKEQMFYWDDPLPWFAFLFEGIKDYRKKMAEKKGT